MAAYRRTRLRAFDGFARYDADDLALADVLEPGFFPAKCGLNLRDEVTIFASDGAVKAYVSGALPTGEPVLSLYLPAAEAAPRRGRPPKVAEAA